MTLHLHVLKGCSPAPLANYLKALGILRLVGEQADQQARGWWEGERFCLLSTLSKTDLEFFFLDKYEPTPLLSPWNGGSGFFPKDNRKAITAIAASCAPRFADFRLAIKAAARAKEGLKAKPDKKQKPQVFRQCVYEWRGRVREWLDAAVVFDESGKPVYPSLLGTGGNDGRLDFTNNFMQQIVALFDVAADAGGARDATRGLLTGSLWLASTNHLEQAAIGQYQPGAAGGANSSTGFDGGNLVNAWDFVLMMEGAVLFAARATRQLDPNALSKASAPFVVRPHSAGYATPGTENAQRGEQWMPLWRQPAVLPDVSSMLGEARIQLGRHVAARSIDAARAISRLGVARGVEAYMRYGYLERNGQSRLAVPLGRISVQQNPRAYLVDDLAVWMDRVHRHNRDGNSPARLVQAEQRLADAVFAALTHDDTPARWQAVLLAAAGIESLQAAGTGIDAGPIPPLRPEWVAAAANDSPEFRLALALGSAAASYFEGTPSDPLRHHFLPLEPGARRFKTAEKRLVNDPRVVAFGRDALRDLSSIIERRLIESAQKGQRRSRIVSATGCGSRLTDIACFLQGAVDVERALGLARAFMAIKWDQWSGEVGPVASPPAEIPDESWLSLRLCCLAWPLSSDRDIPADERIVRLMQAGEPARAIDLARQRLRSVGIRPPFYSGTSDSVTARRWAAALAFPIHRNTALESCAILDPTMKGHVHA